MASVGEFEGNGEAERLLRTINAEKVDLSDYEDFGDASLGLGRFFDDVYDHKRIHLSRGCLTPGRVRGPVRRETLGAFVSAGSVSPTVFLSQLRGALQRLASDI